MTRWTASKDVKVDALRWGMGFGGIKSLEVTSILIIVDISIEVQCIIQTSYSGSSRSRPYEMSRRMLRPQFVMAWRYLATDWLVSAGNVSPGLGDPGVR